MKRVMVVVAIVMVLTLALSAGTASAGTGYPGFDHQGYGGGQQVYIVQAGDTLSAIAFRYGVSVFELARVNGLFNPNLIFRGQCLIIPMRYQPMPGPMPGPIYNQGGCGYGCDTGWNTGWDGCYGGCYGGGYYGSYWGSQIGWGGWGYDGCSQCDRGPAPVPYVNGLGRKG
jgi:hypothetical protein